MTTKEKECEETCECCEGAGEISIPAHQKGGDVVDEEIIRCRLCDGSGCRMFARDEKETD